MVPEPPSRPPVRWRKLLLKGTFWLSAEVVLNLMGLDNLADYSEFLLQSRTLEQMGEVAATVVNIL